ncbi:MAG: pyridoxamine 5'-phosphate oxidase family protein [Polyangiaceae bacterium]
MTSRTLETAPRDVAASTSATPVEESPAERHAHVGKILATLRDVMFLSHSSGGHSSGGEFPAVSARPLHVTRLDDDHSMWFMVALDSKAVAEIRRHDVVSVTGHEGARWIHLTGRARVVDDRERVRAVWSKFHEVWFPDGPDDPNVGLVHFVPEGAEYWDTSGTRGLRYLFESAKALVTNTRVEPVPGSHGTTGHIS